MSDPLFNKFIRNFVKIVACPKVTYYFVKISQTSSIFWNSYFFRVVREILIFISNNSIVVSIVNILKFKKCVTVLKSVKLISRQKREFRGYSTLLLLLPLALSFRKQYSRTLLVAELQRQHAKMRFVSQPIISNPVGKAWTKCPGNWIEAKTEDGISR